MTVTIEFTNEDLIGYTIVGCPTHQTGCYAPFRDGLIYVGYLNAETRATLIAWIEANCTGRVIMNHPKAGGHQDIDWFTIVGLTDPDSILVTKLTWEKPIPRQWSKRTRADQEDLDKVLG